MITALLISQILLWVLMAGILLMVFLMLRQIGVLFERVAPAGALSMNATVSAGDKVPELTAPTLAGHDLRLQDRIGDGTSTLLFFLSATCPVCKELLPVVKDLRASEAGLGNVLYVGSAQEEGHDAVAMNGGLDPENYLVSDAIGMAFSVAKLPYAVLIDGAGKVASFGLVNSREHLESLFEAQRENVASIQDYMARSRRGDVA